MTVESKPSDGADPIDLGREADFVLGPLTVHPSTCEVAADDRRETIQPRAMQVLVALARAGGAVVSRDQLIELCWDGRVIGDDAINRAVAKVRDAAGLTDPPAFEIETIPRVGFRLRARDSAAPSSVSVLDQSSAGDVGRSRSRNTRMLLVGIGSVGVALIVLVAAAVWFRPGGHSSVTSRSPDALASIAVLPFLNMSGDPAKEYFSDGFSEELLNDLANVPQLHVAARTSAFSFKGKRVDIDDIARKLRVRTVLEGSVRESGSRVRITAQLIDAASGYHLWSKTYDRQLTDILKVQDEIARSITGSLIGKLLAPPAAAATEMDPEAYRKYLLGKLYFYRQTLADNDRAIALFRDVTLLQPKFSDAFAMLGYAYVRKIASAGAHPAVPASVAEAALNTALSLNPRNLTALNAKMNLALARQEWSTAGGVVRRMQRINAKNATVMRALGVYYAALGFPDRAAAQYRLTTKLDPLSPIAWGLLEDQEAAFDHYDAAIEAANAALALVPDSPGPLGWLCVARVARGELDEAKRLAAKLEQTPDGRQLKGCAMAIAMASGHHDEAVRIVDERVKNNQGVVAYMAQNYLDLGEYQKAIALLHRAYDEGDAVLYRLPLEPDTPRDFLKTAAWKELTQLPRFRAWQAAHDKLAAELASHH